MADTYPRPPYDTSAATAAGRSPSEMANAEWASTKVKLELSIVSDASNAPPTGLATDTVRIVKNTITGRVSLWANSGGQIIDLLSFAPLNNPKFNGTVKTDALQILGPGSTGSVDQMTAAGMPFSDIVAATAYMPPPSGDAATDAANFAAAQARPVRVILFQAGTYLVPNTGYASLKPGQEVVGQGLLKTTLKAATAMAPGNEGIIRGFETADIAVRDLTVDYAGFREPAAGWAPLNFRSVDKLRVTNVGVVGWSRFGISINGGVDWRVEGARLVRAAAPIKADGTPIAKGEQNQCLVVSQTVRASVNGYFGRSYCEGSAVNISGSFFTFEDNEINGFDFGFGFVSEQDPQCHHHQYLRNRVRGGRTNPTTGLDVNGTSAGGFEMWAPYTLLDGNEMWDLGGDGITLGAKNSRVVNNTVRDVGNQIKSDGIVSRYELSGAYSAHGSIIANNAVPNTNGSGDGSNLNLPYSEQDLTGDMVVRMVGNDFGTIPLTRKGIGARWASPGLFFKVSAGAYTHSPGSLLIPIDLSLPGARRSGDVIVGVAFKGNDGSALPAGLRAFAEVTSDNVVKFYTEDISGGSSNITVPAGTFTGRLISID